MGFHLDWAVERQVEAATDRSEVEAISWELEVDWVVSLTRLLAMVLSLPMSSLRVTVLVFLPLSI